ncbi:MAG: glycosyltransferase [Fimbriimonadales bacterium]|nr:glycosyltransferase [Fimbriimonadales bacterium]
MSKRLALYLPSLAGGGAERVMVQLANEFVSRGHRVDMILVHPEFTYRSELDPAVNLEVINPTRRLLGLHILAKTTPYLRRGYDGMLCCIRNFPPILAKRVARSRTRVVIQEVSQPSLVFAGLEGKEWEARLATHLGYRFVYPLADGVVAVSKGVAEELQRITRIRPNRLHIIYNPAITLDFYEKANAPVEHPWFQSSEPPVILGVARLHAVKGFDILLRAFAQVVQQTPARLLILGEGDERTRLEQLVCELNLQGLVAMPGFDPNPFRYMRRAGVFVLSSRTEGMPVALIQALACGCPVVSTRCSSGVEEVLNGDQYGLVVPVDDVNALAEAILRVLRGERRQAPPEWLEQFRVERIAEQYLRVLLDCGK